MLKQLATLLSLGLLLAGPARDQEPDNRSKLLVFANRSTEVSKLSRSQLRSLLLGETPKWPDDREVMVLLVDDKSLARTLKSVLHMSRADYMNHFLISEYRSVPLNKPRLVPSTSEALRYLTTTPGAITVLEGEPDMVVGGARLIRIDGKLPDDDGYKL